MRNIIALLALTAALVLIAGCSTVQRPSNNQTVDNAKTFTLTGGMYWYEMDGQRAPVLRVQRGDTVKIEFTSVEGFHDWVVDEFNAATERVNTNGSTSVVFVANTPGTYEYYCSVGNHRANGMVGTLVVE